MSNALEFGIDTFGDVTPGPDGTLKSHAQVIRDVVEEGVLADQVGLDFIGIGEHHRADYSISAPDTVLTAIAAKTERIRVGSAVTVLSSDDPIRVFQRFATIDAISNGRAEVILGRGSFIESFPLFGYDLQQYEELFEEKLDLFMKVREQNPVTWSGTTRRSLTDQEVFPHVENGLLPAWIAVGGSPQSVVRAAGYGLPLMLAIIGGDPLAFKQFTDLYRRALGEFGKPLQPVGVHAPGYIAETDEQAMEDSWPLIGKYFSKIALERGGRAMGEGQFRAQVGPEGAYFIGSPETVAKKIVRVVKGLDLDRFDFKYANGPMEHGKLLNSLELYGTKVVPLVREMLHDGA
ncbi:flavin-dependent oxidoreductase, F420-dependent methylene-tetrahydromethanopterin reductase [Sanguibacter keddieii DSM 10542]|uniref:Flavin-dependent oxidoreductase, F420-dependent methylene-tetrahydromethanopterin reductase n=1 Tax=Sanguibacter keddieii (strain ATCC 51767 / DSM 10542 / NCFB 3025 / ST-74) TaxID=446469 RepID=D1BJI6_SANKS|nr:LLM class flavin-dependent oxidoreductase [Sanguibacter keddieii]ACZ20242.1 flavin-dependent oxidoreductase, F420-dependent methylene-tetrahydromethanopterin reductase [Sanguibacter keddieii DSM 10542]